MIPLTRMGYTGSQVDPIRVNASINDQPVQMEVGTGSGDSLISEGLFHVMPVPTVWERFLPTETPMDWNTQSHLHHAV